MSLEVPPPVNPNAPQEWSEQLVDFLVRKFAVIEQRLDEIDTTLADHEARITALEPPP